MARLFFLLFWLVCELDRGFCNEAQKEKRAAHFADFVQEKLLPRFGYEITQRALYDAEVQEMQEGIASCDIYKQRALYLKIEKQLPKETGEFFRTQFLKLLGEISNSVLHAQFQEIDAVAQEIEDIEAKRQLYFELFKTLSYHRDIPSFACDYLGKQAEILWLAVKVASLCDYLPEELFPVYSNKPSIHFIFDRCDEEWMRTQTNWKPHGFIPPFPIAVSKENGQWAREQFAWEAACLFGVDEAFMPTIALSLYGKRMSVQPYWSALSLSWPKDRFNSKMAKEHNSSLVQMFAMRPFSACCVGSLLISLYDQASVNTLNKQLRDGNRALLNFDNGASFLSFNGFLPDFRNPDRPGEVTHCGRSYWAWYYDFPQTETPITGSDLAFLQKLIGDWPECFEDFKTYLNHPLNNFIAANFKLCIEAFEERLQIIHKLVMESNGSLTLKKLLYAIVPPYEPLLKAMESKIPESKGMAMTALSCPNHSFDEVKAIMINRFRFSPEACEDFLTWYRQFALTLLQPH